MAETVSTGMTKCARLVLRRTGMSAMEFRGFSVKWRVAVVAFLGVEYLLCVFTVILEQFGWKWMFLGF